jgi:hypothetical protein
MAFVPLNTNNSNLANYNSVNNAIRDLNNKKIKNADLSTTPGDIGGAWVAFTPTWVNFTLGNGTTAGYYTRIGNTIIGWANVTAGTTTALGTTTCLTPPVTPSSRYTGTLRFIDTGNITFLDSGTQVYHGTGYFDQNTSSGNIVLSIYGVAGTYAIRTTTSSTVPFTLATGDQITVEFTYEAA